MPVTTKSPFKALMPRERVVILLLVENSSTMSNMWNEVQQHCLAPLGEMLQFSNEDSSASVCCASYGSDVRFSRITLFPEDDDFSAGKHVNRVRESTWGPPATV